MSRAIPVTDPGPAGRERLPLTRGWELARTPPGTCQTADQLEGQRWVPASVPGTAAGALGREQARRTDFDAEDWWFRLRFEAQRSAAGEEVVLQLGGLATIAEVYLNGRRVLDSESMFAAHELGVGDLLQEHNELAICCRALGPRLRVRRRPRARWRTKIASEPNLRFYRTMLLGRAPGFAPGPAVVGPWRPVVLERRRGLMLDRPRLRTRMVAEAGQLEVSAGLRALPGARLPERLQIEVHGATEEHAAELVVTPGPDGAGTARGGVSVPGARLWWPHTHGSPERYEVRIADGDRELYRGRVGFRRLRAASDIARDGLDLRINEVPVFVRGAVWTPLDLLAPHADESALRRTLGRLVECGLNLLRVPGTAAYESVAFYDLCDELGILVWQDFMFANFDYPEQDGDFMAAVEREASSVLAQLGGRPSLAVVCGGSEVAQQVAMLGLDPGLAEGPLYGELLPRIVRDAEVEAPYVPSAPWGGELPFRTDQGVANYYGVGAYRRPLEDVRRSEVRFASECLAFANVPDEPALEEIDAPGGLAVHHPAWKAGVPRDAGAGWDFDDVRDHYLKLLLGIDPVGLRSVDHERYLELSRAVSGEVMTEVFGEWRRAGSPCRGGIVLWAKDLCAGAGWGILDHRGEPKVAYHHLRRALAPVAVWSTDEGLGGVVAHIANDRSEPLRVRLRVALYRDFHQLTEESAELLELPPHGAASRNVESLLGHFVDVAWAYRFGPPAQDLIVMSLESEQRDGYELVSQAFRFPAGRPLSVQPAGALGLTASLRSTPHGGAELVVKSAAFAHGVRATVPGHRAGDDAFSVEPGHERVLALRPDTGAGDAEPPSTATLTALNLAGRLRVEAEDG